MGYLFEPLPQSSAGRLPALASAQLELLRVSHLSLVLPSRSESTESPDAAPSAVQAAEQPAVIPTQGDLLGDLLNLDLGPPVSGPPIATSSVQMGAVDLLGGGLDSLVRRSPVCSFPDAQLYWWHRAGFDAGSCLDLLGTGQACPPGDVWASPLLLQLVKTEGHCALIYLVIIRWLERGSGLVLLSAFSLGT